MHNKQAETEKHSSHLGQAQPAAAQVGVSAPVATEPQLAVSALRALIPSVPLPPIPDGIVIPFTKEETVAILEQGIGANDIRDLVNLMLRGVLRQVAEDAAA
jgi:hypothetical protein